jgi:tellurite methyltransferase
MADTDRPSQFVVHATSGLAAGLPAPRRALDLAMGRGRHFTTLASVGYRVFGVDVKFEAVRDAVARAAASGSILRGWCADLTEHPLPRERFELVVVSRYLQRDLFASLCEAVVPGGAVVYETFTEAQRAHGTGPTSPDHLLKEGELRSLFPGFDVLFYEEVDRPEAVARLVARKRPT